MDCLNKNKFMKKTQTIPPASAEVTPLPTAAMDTTTTTITVAPVPGESDRAFEAFQMYLELGPRRRYLAVARKTGLNFRTIHRWANQFSWSDRAKTHTARLAGQTAQMEEEVQRAELQDATSRAKQFRDRQYALADAILEVAERYLEEVADEDLHLMRFTDACKAMDFASRIMAQAQAADAGAPDQGLRDQLTALLDQACAKVSANEGNAPVAAHFNQGSV